MEKDSGYFSHKSGDFKLSGFSDGSRRYLYSQSLLKISFDEFKNSSKYCEFANGFADEDDFEDFKRDLKDFYNLRHQVHENLFESREKLHESLNPDLDSSVSNMLSEFFDNEETFREFNEVFDDFDRLYETDFNVLKRFSQQSGPIELENDVHGLSDFFDNDEDFMEFEREFNNFKDKRRSQFRNSNSLRRISSREILSDILSVSRKHKRKSSHKNQIELHISSSSESDDSEKESPVNLRLKVPDNLSSNLVSSVNSNSLLKSRAKSNDSTPISIRNDSNDIYSQLLDEGVVNRRKKSSSNIDHRHKRIFDILSYLSCEDISDIGTNSSNSSTLTEALESEDVVHNDDCQYTCHHNCKKSVTLDCTGVSHQTDGATTPQDNKSNLHLPSHHEDTDSGYRSGSYDTNEVTHLLKVERQPSEATLTREDLKRHLHQYNEKSPGSNFTLNEDGTTFQGFIRVTLNLVRPITMSLSVHPPSIYEALTREHIVEQNTQSLSFYMPRDTVKSIHVTSKTTTKEVIAALLHKFRILDHPRKFAMYEQEFQNNKIVKLRRISNTECPITTCLTWNLECLDQHRLVMQENETGEIEWHAFSMPELLNFLKILDREESECVNQLEYKYKLMKRIIVRRIRELRKERGLSGVSSA